MMLLDEPQLLGAYLAWVAQATTLVVALLFAPPQVLAEYTASLNNQQKCHRE